MWDAFISVLHKQIYTTQPTSTNHDFIYFVYLSLNQTKLSLARKQIHELNKQIILCKHIISVKCFAPDVNLIYEQQNTNY